MIFSEGRFAGRCLRYRIASRAEQHRTKFEFLCSIAISYVQLRESGKQYRKNRRQDLLWRVHEAELAGIVGRYPPLVSTQRPFFGAGLSCAQGNKQTLCCRSISTNSPLKVTDLSYSRQHPAQFSFLAPFGDRRPNHSRDLGEKVHLLNPVCF
jgi:hypothetical protein